MNYPHPLPEWLNLSANFYRFYTDNELSTAIYDPLFHKFDENTILLNGCLQFNKEKLPAVLYMECHYDGDQVYTDNNVRVIKLEVTKITTFQSTDQNTDDIIFFPINIHELTVNVIYEYVGENTCSDVPSDIIQFLHLRGFRYLENK